MENNYFECECNCKEHVLQIDLDTCTDPQLMDYEDNRVFISTYLDTKRKWYRRIYTAIKHVFGYQSVFGAFSEIMIKREDYDKFINIFEKAKKLDKELKENTESKNIRKKIKRNLDTPESREFWARAEKVAKQIENWPDWKKGWSNIFPTND